MIQPHIHDSLSYRWFAVRRHARRSPYIGCTAITSSRIEKWTISIGRMLVKCGITRNAREDSASRAMEEEYPERMGLRMAVQVAESVKGVEHVEGGQSKSITRSVPTV